MHQRGTGSVRGGISVGRHRHNACDAWLKPEERLVRLNEQGTVGCYLQAPLAAVESQLLRGVAGCQVRRVDEKLVLVIDDEQIALLRPSPARRGWSL